VVVVKSVYLMRRGRKGFMEIGELGSSRGEG
jgi:hypothetical protein